jgi:hypothetical protein
VVTNTEIFQKLHATSGLPPVFSKQLISVALNARLGDVGPAPDQALRNRVVGYIEARLSDRNLAPARIAAAHHISVRRLFKATYGYNAAALISSNRARTVDLDLAEH